MVTASQKKILCTTCELFIEGVEEYKTHFLSELHKYNCKRKLAALTPLTPEEYDEKKNKVLNSSTSEISEDGPFNCALCGKHFSSNKQYTQHLASKKHLKNSKAPQASSEENKQGKMDGAPPLKLKTSMDSLSVCLFCNEESKTAPESLKHMAEKHSFILPYADQLKDKTAVLKYLAEKIHIGNICLGCNNNKTGSFKSYQAVQQHMMDKGHTFIDLDIFQNEYANFVKHKEEFIKKRAKISQRISAVMSEKELEEMKREEEAKGGVVSRKPRPKRPQKAAAEQSAESDKKPHEDDWMDMDLNNIEGAESSEKQKDASESSSVSGDSAYDEHIMMENGELLLSNGKRIGNRMYNYIYKQKLPLADQRESVAIGKSHIEDLKKRMKTRKVESSDSSLQMKNYMVRNELAFQKKLSAYNI